MILLAKSSSSSPQSRQRRCATLLRRACAKHDELMNEARNNSGCDRHMLGLMLTSKELGLELHEIFTDDAWKKRFVLYLIGK